jgi:intraflagellar transport protein 20
MAEEALSHAGLYLDELNKIRLLEPEMAQQTNELKDECKEFVDSSYFFSSLLWLEMSRHPCV